jgi:hypothetical protein
MRRGSRGRRLKRRAGQGRDSLASFRQPRDQRRQGDIKRRGRFLVGETGQNDNQQRLSELQGKRADGCGHAGLAHARIAVRAVRIFVPCRLPIVQGQPTNMPAMKSNELAERAHTCIVRRRPVRVASNARAHCFERSLPEQAIDKRDRRGMIKHESVVSRERHPESSEVGEICQAVA